MTRSNITVLLLATLVAILITVLSTLASAENLNVQQNWQDVTASLHCSYHGADGNCYFGPTDEIVQGFIRQERQLKVDTSYLWQYNHGRPKAELDNNNYYWTMKTNEGR